MVHTMQLMCRARKKKVEDILADIDGDEDIIQAFLDGREDKLELDIDDIFGIVRIIIYKVTAEDADGLYMVNLVINPQVLSTGRRTMRLFDCSEDAVQRLCHNFSLRCKELTSAKLPDLEKWSVRRIDFAVDLNVPRPDYYAMLAKRVKYPRLFVEKHKGQGSGYHGCQSVLLNFYDKHDQVQKDYSHLSYYDELEIEARGIFRAEIQCDYSKVKTIRVEKNLPNTKAITMLRREIASEVVERYFLRTFGRQDFIFPDEAERRIAAASWQTAKKQRVLDMLQLIRQARKIVSAKEQYVDGTQIRINGKIVQGTATQFDGYVNDCRSLGFSPVMLPREWDIESPINPYDDLLRAISEAAI